MLTLNIIYEEINIRSIKNCFLHEMPKVKKQNLITIYYDERKGLLMTIRISQIYIMY